MRPKYCELQESGLIAVSGPEAATFLQSQFTSDVAALSVPKTQYSGYCTPKGRLLATFLLWRLQDEIILQLPGALSEPIRSRLSKYILRAKVTASDASPRYVLFGVAGPGARNAIGQITVAPQALHEVAVRPGIAITYLPGERYLALVAADSAAEVRRVLEAHAGAAPESIWSDLDLEAGIPVITPQTQEQYVPQMVNLDLIDAVSYSKGCYPGQEIVARTHYLGRIKQRTFHVRLPAGIKAQVGDRLYSDEYGAEQASGVILNIATAGNEALAVLYTSAVKRGVRFGALDGPPVDVLPLPYSLQA